MYHMHAVCHHLVDTTNNTSDFKRKLSALQTKFIAKSYKCGAWLRCLQQSFWIDTFGAFHKAKEILDSNAFVTRMHSSRMRTAHVLAISPSMHCSGGGLAPGGCLLPGVSALGWEGVSAPGGEGGLLTGGRGYPSMHWGRPPCEQNDRQVQKYYLAPNFVCGR